MLTSRRRGLVEPVLFIIVRLLRDGWIEKMRQVAAATKDFAPRRPADIPSEADLLGAIFIFELIFTHRPPQPCRPP